MYFKERERKRKADDRYSYYNSSYKKVKRCEIQCYFESKPSLCKNLYCAFFHQKARPGVKVESPEEKLSDPKEETKATTLNEMNYSLHMKTDLPDSCSKTDLGEKVENFNPEAEKLPRLQEILKRDDIFSTPGRQTPYKYIRLS